MNRVRSLAASTAGTPHQSRRGLRVGTCKWLSHCAPAFPSPAAGWVAGAGGAALAAVALARPAPGSRRAGTLAPRGRSPRLIGQRSGAGVYSLKGVERHISTLKNGRKLSCRFSYRYQDILARFREVRTRPSRRGRWRTATTRTSGSSRCPARGSAPWSASPRRAEGGPRACVRCELFAAARRKPCGTRGWHFPDRSETSRFCPIIWEATFVILMDPECKEKSSQCGHGLRSV